LGRRRNAYLVGLELAESETLLDELWSFVDRPEFAWEHIWRVGDLVLWDNRCTMHRRDAFDPSSRRIMHRTQVKGEQRPSCSAQASSPTVPPRRGECGEAAFEIADQVVDVLKSDVQAHRRPARRPCRRRADAGAVEWNGQALEPAPRRADAEQAEL